MGELVNAITTLCKVLDILLGRSGSLKPDFFRLSKLNKLGLEQIQQICDVTHKICCFNAANTSCCDDSYKCIESYMRKHRGVATYFLSPSATARQLLICLGFLLSERVIEDNIDRILMTTPLSEELPSFMLNLVPSGDLGQTTARPDEVDSQHLFNYALFVSGKVQHNVKAIANFNQERVQLFSKIHRATAGVHGFTHLSVGDLLMTVRPELQAEFLSKCKHCVPLLQAYAKWHRKKHIFYEWMISVVEEEFRNQSEQQSVDEITHLHEFLRKLKSDVQKPQDGESSSGGIDIRTTSRRMCLSKDGKVMDSMIENMDREIKNLKKDNERKIEIIKLHLLKTNNRDHVINSVLKTFCDIGSMEEELLKRTDSELSSVSNLTIQSTD